MEKKSQQNIIKKLLEFQKKVDAVEKGKTNPYYKSKYADVNDYLKAIKPILNELGLIIIQPLDGDRLITQVIDAESGELVGCSVNLPVNPDPQKQGSIITYFRRYSIQSLLSLQAEDDDANSGKDNNSYPTDKAEQIKKMINQSTNVDGLIEYAEKLKSKTEFTAEQKKEIEQALKNRIDQLQV